MHRWRWYFNSANGSLLNLVDKTTGQDLSLEEGGEFQWLHIHLHDAHQPTPQYAGGYLAGSVSLSPIYVSTGVQLTAQFGQFTVNGTALDLSAKLVVTVDNSSPLTSWQLSIVNHAQITIESVSLPSIIAGIGQESSDNPAN